MEHNGFDNPSYSYLLRTKEFYKNDIAKLPNKSLKLTQLACGKLELVMHAELP